MEVQLLEFVQRTVVSLVVTNYDGWRGESSASLLNLQSVRWGEFWQGCHRGRSSERTDMVRFHIIVSNIGIACTLYKYEASRFDQGHFNARWEDRRNANAFLYHRKRSIHWWNWRYTRLELYIYACMYMCVYVYICIGRRLCKKCLYISSVLVQRFFPLLLLFSSFAAYLFKLVHREEGEKREKIYLLTHSLIHSPPFFDVPGSRPLVLLTRTDACSK